MRSNLVVLVMVGVAVLMVLLMDEMGALMVLAAGVGSLASVALNMARVADNRADANNARMVASGGRANTGGNANAKADNK